jgi:hypothetical protein
MSLEVNKTGNTMSRNTILLISLLADLRARLDAEAVREYLDRRARRGFDEAREVAAPWTAAFDTFEEYER